MSVRLQIAALVFMMVQAVLFGAGAVAILLTPALRDQGFFYMPLMIAATMIVAALLSWMIAPRLQARYWRRRGVDHDVISG